MTIYAIGRQIGLIFSFFSSLKREEGVGTTVVPLILAPSCCTDKFFSESEQIFNRAVVDFEKSVYSTAPFAITLFDNLNSESMRAWEKRLFLYASSYL